MRLTRAGEYAVRCVLYLSFKGCGEAVGRKEVARVMDIPDQFLSKIARDLARADIIEIVQGARGGFRLLREPADLVLLEVVEAVVGRIFLNDCVRRPASCDRSPTCTVHSIWKRACDQLRDTLGRADFATLLGSQEHSDVLRKAASAGDAPPDACGA